MREASSSRTVTDTDSYAFFFYKPIKRQREDDRGTPKIIMKRLALLILFAVSVMAVTAQSSTQMATLCHDGEISTFYNANALKEAYSAAVDGDVITLSSGSFASVNLNTKKVTLRGAGMEDGPNRTMIIGSLLLTVLPTEENADIPMIIEGIYFHGVLSLESIFELTMIKCGFSEVSVRSASTLRNCTFLHCMLNKGNIDFEDAIISFKNCYFGDVFLGGSAGSTYNLDHCTVNFSKEGEGRRFRYCNMSDCLIFGPLLGNFERDAAGCVYVGDYYLDPFEDCSSATNRVYPVGTKFLKEGSRYYELTDEKAAEWIGIDGTQVGMHGGSMPFDPTTSNPRITRFDVSSKTTSDGRLAVDIEVQTY
ncbi:MAG: hypothetical protein K2L71_05440 [Muribaculaceae bacterium]|nr:hypothetical protein [Muribaculaceae bacterium]